MVVTLALILTFSPPEKEQPLSVFRFANDRPANPVTNYDSPSPWGEGRDEGGRETLFNSTEKRR
jgi:hypothetical protein